MIQIRNNVWFGQEPEPEYNPGKTARDEERERLEQEILLREVPFLFNSTGIFSRQCISRSKQFSLHTIVIRLRFYVENLKTVGTFVFYLYLLKYFCFSPIS